MVGNGSEGPIKSLDVAPKRQDRAPSDSRSAWRRFPGSSACARRRHGVPAYLVGGAVRDLLLGRERADIDVAVEGEVGELAAGSVGRCVRTSASAPRPCAWTASRSTWRATRSETYARPGALPEVRPASLAADLARRDFTVNAMAVPLDGDPELIDPHRRPRGPAPGRAARPAPGSFEDDPTRALRAARYAARYGFALERRDRGADLERADLSTVSRDRTEAELRKLAAEPKARRAFELLGEWGLLELGPELLDLVAAAGELAAEEPWRQVAPRADAVLAAALDRGVAEARELASAEPERPSQLSSSPGGEPGSSWRWPGRSAPNGSTATSREWREVRLEIGGSDLIAEGVAEGPAVGRGLREALRAKLDGEVHGREEELRAALAAARENAS